MADHPARRGYDPAAEDTGWGSPMPAEYGSLTAFLPPLADTAPEPEEPAPPEPRPARRRAAPRQAEPAARESRFRARRPRPVQEAPPRAANRPPPLTEDLTDPPANGAGPLARLDAAPIGVEPPGVDRPSRRTPPAPASPDGGGVSARTPAGVPLRTRPQARGAIPSTRRTSREPRRRWAQSERTVRHLDVWSVAKVSLVFYLLLLIAVVVASVMLWYLADAVGAIQSIEKSVRTLFDLSKFTLHPVAVATYTSIGGAILALGGTLANILVAFMYNLISDVVGGIRFRIVEDANPDGR